MLGKLRALALLTTLRLPYSEYSNKDIHFHKIAGSGKRALLEVISRRAQGPTRGQIMLNGVPMSMRLFQESCGYVTQKCDLLSGLSVSQTLHYAAMMTIGSKVTQFR